MRDFRDAKAMAQALRAALAAMGIKITVSQSLELIAETLGVADWNTLSAAIQSAATATPERTPQRPPTTESAQRPAGVALPPADFISKEFEATLNQAFAFAKGRNHEILTLEHLLLFLLEDVDASRVMKGCGVNLEVMRKGLTEYIDHHLKEVQAADVADYPAGYPQPTRDFQRVLQRAVYHVKTAGKLPVKSLNVLVAMFSERESRAVQLFSEQSVGRVDVVNFISHGTIKGAGGPPDSA